MGRASRRASLRNLALAAALAVLAHAAHAQHPAPPSTRPFPTRAALADAIVVASIEEVELGRLHVANVRTLAGEVPERFQVKRAPGAPPPLAAGDRAILLLRGARPPYVLVDEPRETIRLADAASEERWTAALSAWLAVRDRPRAWIEVYLDWIESGPDTLRQLAVQGLIDPKAPFQPVDPGVYEELARRAWDPERSLEGRRVAALLARLGAGPALARGLLAAPLDCDPEIASAALAGAVGHEGFDPTPVLLRGLDHRDADVRKNAVDGARNAAPFWGGHLQPELRERIERLAREDGESWLREQAEKTLAMLGS